jgi:hypothetical protein
MRPPKFETRNQKSEKATGLSLLRDGLTGACCSHEILEETLRKRIIRHTLGMPLNADNPI